MRAIKRALAQLSSDLKAKYDSMTLLSACLVLLTVYLSCSTVLGQVAYVEPAINTAASPGSGCIGGNVGLTNTSIRIEYRLLRVEAGTTTGITEWLFLHEVPLNGGTVTPGWNFDVSRMDEVVHGVQLRLLQIEHGGGDCNCWNLTQVTIVLNSQSVINYEACFGSPTVNEFCGGIASRFRGVITQAIYPTSTIGDMCPVDSDSMLVTNKGPPLPPNCLNNPRKM